MQGDDYKGVNILPFEWMTILPSNKKEFEEDGPVQEMNYTDDKAHDGNLKR